MRKLIPTRSSPPRLVTQLTPRHGLSPFRSQPENARLAHQLKGADLRAFMVQLSDSELVNLKAFKDSVPDSHSVGANAKEVVLWTEAGALRHAKLLHSILKYLKVQQTQQVQQGGGAKTRFLRDLLEDCRGGRGGPICE